MLGFFAAAVVGFVASPVLTGQMPWMGGMSGGGNSGGPGQKGGGGGMMQTGPGGMGGMQQDGGMGGQKMGGQGAGQSKGETCNAMAVCRCECAYTYAVDEDDKTSLETSMRFKNQSKQIMCDTYSLDHCEKRDGDVCTLTAGNVTVTGKWSCEIDYIRK